MITALLVALVAGGCSGDGSELNLEAVEVGLLKELVSQTFAEDVTCVSAGEHEAECSVVLTGFVGEPVAVVRCDKGSCTWYAKANRAERGAFRLEDRASHYGKWTADS